MTKLPIKFRGLAISDMEEKKNFKPRLVYGSVRTTESGDYACIATFKNERGETFTYVVAPETVAQLVGYDADGKEVYEGDPLVTENGETIYATIYYRAKIASAKDISFTDIAKQDGWKIKTVD